LKFFGRPIPSLSLNEPLGTKSFLTDLPAPCIRIELIGFFRSMLTEIPHPLLQLQRLGDLLLPNQVVMAPLTRGRAHNPWHVPNDLMREYYEQRAAAGLIISEGIWVSEDGQGWLGATGIYNRQQGVGWKAITDSVHGKGGRIFAQLWHQGAVPHPSFFNDGRLPSP
jgi:N-ethylmaleimide reductase